MKITERLFCIDMSIDGGTDTVHQVKGISHGT
jgi:hypothetical protein